MAESSPRRGYFKLLVSVNIFTYQHYELLTIEILVEAFANVVIGGIGLLLTGGTKNLPQDMFALSGVSQVSHRSIGYSIFETSI
jgi:hypothetical protein